jgi:hypothetical protein
MDILGAPAECRCARCKLSHPLQASGSSLGCAGCPCPPVHNVPCVMRCNPLMSSAMALVGFGLSLHTAALMPHRRCELKCASQQALQVHYQRQCPHAVVPCRFKGCNYYAARSQLVAHEETCPVGRAACVSCGVWMDKDAVLLVSVTQVVLRSMPGQTMLYQSLQRYQCLLLVVIAACPFHLPTPAYAVRRVWATPAALCNGRSFSHYASIAKVSSCAHDIQYRTLSISMTIPDAPCLVGANMRRLLQVAHLKQHQTSMAEALRERRQVGRQEQEPGGRPPGVVSPPTTGHVTSPGVNVRDSSSAVASLAPGSGSASPAGVLVPGGGGGESSPPDHPASGVSLGSGGGAASEGRSSGSLQQTVASHISGAALDPLQSGAAAHVRSVLASTDPQPSVMPLQPGPLAGTVAGLMSGGMQQQALSNSLGHPPSSLWLNTTRQSNAWNDMARMGGIGQLLQQQQQQQQQAAPTQYRAQQRLQEHPTQGPAPGTAASARGLHHSSVSAGGAGQSGRSTRARPSRLRLPSLVAGALQALQRGTSRLTAPPSPPLATPPMPQAYVRPPLLRDPAGQPGGPTQAVGFAQGQDPLLAVTAALQRLALQAQQQRGASPHSSPRASMTPSLHLSLTPRHSSQQQAQQPFQQQQQQQRQQPSQPGTPQVGAEVVVVTPRRSIQLSASGEPGAQLLVQFLQASALSPTAAAATDGSRGASFSRTSSYLRRARSFEHQPEGRINIGMIDYEMLEGLQLAAESAAATGGGHEGLDSFILTTCSSLPPTLEEESNSTGLPSMGDTAQAAERLAPAADVPENAAQVAALDVLDPQPVSDGDSSGNDAPWVATIVDVRPLALRRSQSSSVLHGQHIPCG